MLCPNCQSNDIVEVSWNFFESVYLLRMRCLTCLHEWNENVEGDNSPIDQEPNDEILARQELEDYAKDNDFEGVGFFDE